MCLTALALDASRQFPLVLAANRDEYFARSAARLAWWTPEGFTQPIISGRDLQGGGTWLGLTAEGRLALVTNLRKPTRADPNAPTRGLIVPAWLRGDMAADRFWPHMALSGHEPFNLIAADFRAGDCFWASSEHASPQRIERGILGLSNGLLDEPWPKVLALKKAVQSGLDTANTVDGLANRLFVALADRSVATDDALPKTGVTLELERMLSPAFIRSADGSYGTRCSTLIITERVGKRLVTHVLERTFTSGPGVALLRRATLKDWPPKYRLDPNTEPDLPAEAGPVSDSELAEPSPPLDTAQRKRRVRSLLRPASKP
jgi:uncharacterized protein with NRDE domain